MKAGPLFLSYAVVLVVCSAGCDTTSVDDGAPACAPTNVAGVWDVNWTDDGNGQISCWGPSRVWTISQSGCNVTIRSDSWDPANGATGTAGGGRLYVEWTWYEGCRGVRETVDAAIDGGSMTGTFYRAVWQQVYPADCPGGGMCSAVLAGTRR